MIKFIFINLKYITLMILYVQLIPLQAMNPKKDLFKIEKVSRKRLTNPTSVEELKEEVKKESFLIKIANNETLNNDILSKTNQISTLEKNQHEKKKEISNKERSALEEVSIVIEELRKKGRESRDIEKEYAYNKKDPKKYKQNYQYIENDGFFYKGKKIFLKEIIEHINNINFLKQDDDIALKELIAGFFSFKSMYDKSYFCEEDCKNLRKIILKKNKKISL